MLTLDKYLSGEVAVIKKRSSSEAHPVTLVLGNESGDLDSVVCSVILAWHLHSAEKPFLPLLNFYRNDLALRSEVVTLLGELQLSLEHVLYLDDVDAEVWGDWSVILVDHNLINVDTIKFLDKNVIEIYDHHVLERQRSSNVKIILERVGSCSTLVAEKIFSENSNVDDVNFLKLVRAAILIDTANLSERTKKATPKDVKVLEVLETRLQGIEQSYMDVRVILFKRLLEAKRDVDHFTLPMLLKKDMKVVHSRKKLSMSTIPGMSCKKLMQKFKETFKEDLQSAKNSMNLTQVILLGSGDMISYPHDGDLALRVRDLMLGEKNRLGVKFVSVMDNCDYFLRTLPHVTRKQILPAVKEAVARESYDSTECAQ